MTLPAYAPNFYTGNGSTATYAYSFKIFDESDLLVIQKDGTSYAETTLVLNTHYTVTNVGAESGGNIVLTSGNLASGQLLIIKRAPAVVQESEFRNHQDFYAEEHEDAFDKMSMIDQELKEKSDRSIKLPEGINTASFDATLPTDIANHPGAAVLVNGSGTGFALGSASGSTDTTKVAKSGDTMTGELVMGSQKAVRFNDLDNSNYVGIKSAAVVASNFEITLPSALPENTKLLTMSSAGVMSTVNYNPGINAVSGADGKVYFNQTPGNAISEWRVVSQGLKITLTNNSDENDGSFEAIRLRWSAGERSMTNQTGQVPLPGTLAYTNLFQSTVIASNFVEHPTYTTGKLRDIHRHTFQLRPTTDDHDFQHIESTGAGNDDIVYKSLFDDS